MRILIILILAVAFMPISRAGVQQDFFKSTIQQATRVTVVKIGPDKTASGGACQHVLLDTKKRKKIESLSSTIEMIDPTPKEGDVWDGSVLTFGVADYIITFFHDDRAILSYGMSKSMDFVTPFGAHAPQETDLVLDYRLTLESGKRIKKLISDL